VAAGVTPNALYRHVDGKRGLEVAIAVAAVRELRAALKPATPENDPVVCVQVMAAQYLDFAARRPHAYKAFSEGKPLPDDPGAIEWLHLWVDFRAVVRRATPQAVDAAGFAIWCYLHGRVELAQSAARAAPLDAGVADTIAALLSGYADITVDSPLPSDLQLLVQTIETEQHA